jgi:hypothetical protein
VLRSSFHHIEAIGDLERAEFILNHSDIHMDAGEQDLAIYALRLPARPAWYLNSPDRASVNFASTQNWLDRLVSLEQLANHIGARPKAGGYANNYTTSWLNQVKTEYRKLS